jgi:hypothetical protein
MLRHAFEEWKCLRVELKTDAFASEIAPRDAAPGRERGRNAAKTRDQLNRPRPRLSLVHILDTEWPEVKSRLEQKTRCA